MTLQTRETTEAYVFALLAFQVNPSVTLKAVIDKLEPYIDQDFAKKFYEVWRFATRVPVVVESETSFKVEIEKGNL